MKSTSEIRIGANGTIRVADVGATLPVDIDAAYSAAWTDLGFVSEDGVTFTDGKNVVDIEVWQLFYPARKIITAREGSVGLALRQWNADTVALAFGGGAVTEDGPGKYRYSPPSPEDIDERALAVDWSDGTINYRLLIPRGMVTENVETNIVRTAAADLPITFAFIGEEGVDPFSLLSDDPAMAPTGS